MSSSSSRVMRGETRDDGDDAAASGRAGTRIGGETGRRTLSRGISGRVTRAELIRREIVDDDSEGGGAAEAEAEQRRSASGRRAPRRSRTLGAEREYSGTRIHGGGEYERETEPVARAESSGRFSSRGRVRGFVSDAASSFGGTRSRGQGFDGGAEESGRRRRSFHSSMSRTPPSPTSSGSFAARDRGGRGSATDVASSERVPIHAASRRGEYADDSDPERGNVDHEDGAEGDEESLRARRAADAGDVRAAEAADGNRRGSLFGRLFDKGFPSRDGTIRSIVNLLSPSRFTRRYAIPIDGGSRVASRAR